MERRKAEEEFVLFSSLLLVGLTGDNGCRVIIRARERRSRGAWEWIEERRSSSKSSSMVISRSEVWYSLFNFWFF